MYIDDRFLEELKERSPIEDVVSGYVGLKRSGGNLLGLCPFHREKTPSFTVSPDKQIFHCFGCSKGGNVITFIMAVENLEFVDAVKVLAQRANMAMPENTDEDRGKSKRKEIYVKIHKKAARFYFSCLSGEEGAKARGYLRARGISDGTIKKFGLGFAPDRWDGLLSELLKEGFTKEEVILAGLAVKNEKGHIYDRFRGRVMYPVINLRGEVIAFGGRVLGDGLPKYLNSPETEIFKKSQNLFSLNFAKKAEKKEILLAEGYMDVLALYQAGFTNAVASLGTSLTFEQAKLLKRYCEEVVLVYDSDGAGKKATERAIDILKNEGLGIRILSLGEAKDPDEYIKRFGPDRFKMLLNGSGNYLDFQILELASKHELNDIEDKAKFLKGLIGILSKIESAIECELYLMRAAQEYGVSYEALRAELKKAKGKDNRKNQKAVASEAIGKMGQGTDHGRDLKYIRAEREALAAVLYNTDLFETLRDLDLDDYFDSKYEGLIGKIIEKDLIQKIETGNFGDSLEPDEMSVVTGVLCETQKQRLTEEQFFKILSILKIEKQKKAAMQPSDDMKEMVKWYNQIKQKKNS